MLRSIYYELVRKYTNSQQLTEELWSEIQTNYSEKTRHYHTLAHLEQLFKQLNEIHNNIADPDTVLVALFYHDIIYSATKSDNEKHSALVAEQRLTKINYRADKISNCVEMILATKKHMLTGNNDIDHFTDADLSILGQSDEVYRTYCTQIRKEYAIFPDLIYNPGRRKVLQHFLNMERIYKTDHFFKKLEERARKNLSNELARL